MRLEVTREFRAGLAPRKIRTSGWMRSPRKPCRGRREYGPAGSRRDWAEKRVSWGGAGKRRGRKGYGGSSKCAVRVREHFWLNEVGNQIAKS